MTQRTAPLVLSLGLAAVLLAACGGSEQAGPPSGSVATAPPATTVVVVASSKPPPKDPPATVPPTEVVPAPVPPASVPSSAPPSSEASSSEASSSEAVDIAGALAVVQRFHEHLDAGELPAAYALFDPQLQLERPYEAWAAAYEGATAVRLVVAEPTALEGPGAVPAGTAVGIYVVSQTARPDGSTSWRGVWTAVYSAARSRWELTAERPAA